MGARSAVRGAVGPWVARHRDAPPFRLAARLSTLYLDMHANYDYEPARNGEVWLLRRLAGAYPKVILDVGANVGDWTAAARAAMPGADIHAFELVPATADRLAARFSGDPGVTVNRCGLLDEEGPVRVKYYPGFSAASSVNDFPHPLPHHWIEAPAATGDAYCRGAGIHHIDLLKIDAEGADHRVLRGFAGLLSAGAVDVVQFEYGRSAIRNRFLLADFYEMLGGHGMAVGKLYPRGVGFRDYDLYRDEDFRGPNFVAVRRERTDLLALLAA